MGRAIILAALVLCLLGVAQAQQLQRPAPSAAKAESSQPQPPAQSAQQHPAPDQRGTESAPVVVKVLPTPKSKEETAQDKTDREDVSAANWWMVRLTGVIGFIGFVQLIVFGLQARRLKQTIKKMDEIASKQTVDTRAMIEEAGKSATAMNSVADSMAANVVVIKETAATNKTIADRQKLITELQTRAYLSITYVGLVPQNNDTMYRFEPRVHLVNNGNTPAYQVRFRSACDCLPFPLPDDFAFPLPDTQASASTGMLGPRLIFLMNMPAPRLYSDIEIAEIRASGTRRLYFWGIVTYNDVFGIPRELKFAQSLVWMADGTSTTGFNTANHNDAT